MFAKGSWQLYSKTDSRWNHSGNSDVGMLTIPEECKEKLEELKTILGNPPDDLEWSYMKD